MAKGTKGCDDKPKKGVKSFKDFIKSKKGDKGKK